MAVTERLMKAGQFTVQLTADAPRSVWAAVQEFDHIVITPTRLQSVESFSDANILAQAIYTGVVNTKPTNRTISGVGLADWLGDDEGGGDLLDTAVTQTTATLSTWVSALLPSSITAGTVTNTGVTLSYTYQFMSRREALAHACRSMGAEWRVNPNGTFDAAAPATLFVATPDTVITRKPQGTEGALQGIEATRMDQARDVAKYTTKVIVVGKTGDGASVATGSATGANVYKDFHNNNVVKERFVNAPAEPAANVSAYAASVLALYSSVRRVITLSSKTYAVPIRTRPGDYLWVYDPDSYLADLSNQITWRGELITPIKLRCHAYTWPIESGMGVYARRSGATPTYTDLTPYVQWDTGDTTWEIGASFADPDQEVAQLSPAFLGVNGDIAARLNGPQWQHYTPTNSNITVGNGTLTARRRIQADGTTHFTWRLVFGSTTAITGSAGIGLPVSAKGSQVGVARYLDQGTRHYVGCVEMTGTTGTLLHTETGTGIVSATAPFTWVTTDVIDVAGTIEPA